MPHHVVVDGSNLATEGRTQPSLAQLNEAVLAYMAAHPDSLITVVVDATFGHRIDAKEVAEFDEGVSNNELVAPPAGAIGRGDAFVLSIADKVKATVISNDSYQEFHGQYPWLFDEGRLVGGKPVPHIGWVFVDRLPVRGPLSRKSVADGKRKRAGGKAVADATVRVGSPEASQPMPVPKGPPPGLAAAKAEPKKREKKAAAPARAAEAPAKSTVNDLLSFLTFVERHPVGTCVNAVVDHYSSHGAYVRIDSVIGYVPLRLMADPPPRSAREFMKVGESVTLVVDRFQPTKRSIDLAIPGVGSTVPLPAAKGKSTTATRRTKAAPEAVGKPAPTRVKKAATPRKAAVPKTAAAPKLQQPKPERPKPRRVEAAEPVTKEPSKKSGGALAKLGLRRRRPAD
ncbi:MAG: S1 RNA-binding domain-containing protein [Actinobacteria bacterium]|nr:S1 RNA-binding domain-containing protein [Actinomycetota bacterium]